MASYRRGYNWEQIAYLPAPVGGWNPDANPWEMPDDQASILDNFLLQSGKIAMRGAFRQIGDLTAVTNPFNTIGYVFLDRTGQTGGALTLSQKLEDATKRVDPWGAVGAGATAAQLAAGGLTIAQLELGSGTLTTLVVTADKVPGPRWILYDGLLYGIGYDSTLANISDVNANYFTKQTSLLTLPQTQAAITAPTILANAPHGAFDLKGYVGRLWLLAGSDTPGASSVHEPVTVYYTIPGPSGVGTASADWRDPVAGATNKIKMDNNSADYGVGLAVVPNAMVVFRANSVWVLRGTLSTTFQLQPLSREVGCVDARSIVETDRGAYFVSSRGLMFTDGAVVRNVSGPALLALQTAVQYQQNVLRSSYSAWVTAALTSQGQIIVSIGYKGIGRTQQPIWTGMYDPALAAWTRLTSSLWTRDNDVIDIMPPMVIARPGRGLLYTAGARSVVQLENPGVNWAIGQSFLLQRTGWEGHYDQDNISSTTPILAQWRTKMMPVISAGLRKFAQAKRYFVDYSFGPAVGKASPTNTAWLVQALNDVGSTLDTGTVLKTTGSRIVNSVLETKGVPEVKRVDVAFLKEVDDVVFDISWQPGGVAIGGDNNWTGDIYGVGLEFQHGRDTG